MPDDLAEPPVEQVLSILALGVEHIARDVGVAAVLHRLRWGSWDVLTGQDPQLDAAKRLRRWRWDPAAIFSRRISSSGVPRTTKRSGNLRTNSWSLGKRSPSATANSLPAKL
jgi:hypothetical protein